MAVSMYDKIHCKLKKERKKETAYKQETQVWSLGRKDPLEQGMATQSSIFAWRIPRTKEPGRLQSIGSQRVGHDWETFTIHGQII